MNAYITTDGNFCNTSQNYDSEEYIQKSFASDYLGNDSIGYDKNDFWINIYPNPNSGNFIVESNMPGTNILTITSITGQNIFLSKKFSQRTYIEMNNYSPGIGIYICRIQNKDILLIQKISVK